MSEIVLGLGAAALYACRLGDWSLWLDETTSLYFSRHLDHSFAKTSVAYFILLDAILERTGMSVIAGRALSAAFGVTNVLLLAVLVRRCATPRAGLIAAALLAVCLFHVFWAQSIRYYTMLLSFELIATLVLYQAVAEARTALFPLAAAFAAASLWVHFSGVLMLPAWGLFLFTLCFADLRQYAKSCMLGVLLAVLPFALAAWFRYPAVQALQASGAVGEAADLHRVASLLIRFVFYIGVPACLFGVVGACVSSVKLEGRLLLIALAAAPLCATLLIAVFSLANVSMHHGFLTAVGLAGLGGIALDAVCRHPAKWVTRIIVGGTMGYYAAGLFLYFSSMHGDRPRWKEATESFKSVVASQGSESTARPTYSTQPLVLAYYLGVPIDELFHQKRVLPFETSADLPPGRPVWMIVDKVELSDATWQWLVKNATRVASFEAHTGPKDRTVTVFRIE